MDLTKLSFTGPSLNIAQTFWRQTEAAAQIHDRPGFKAEFFDHLQMDRYGYVWLRVNQDQNPVTFEYLTVRGTWEPLR